MTRSPALPMAARRLPMTARRPGAPLSGCVRVPGDKSISHRALMLAGLAVGRSRILGLLEGEDVLRTAAAMQALGAAVTREAAGVWGVDGVGIGGLAEPDDVLDMGNAGTGARLVLGILASHPVVAMLTGDGSLRRRPMRRVMEPLALCGARFVARAAGRLPLCVEGTGAALPIEYRLPVASAQVKSAVLLAGLNARGQTRVVENVATRDHTETMLRHFGAEIAVLGEAGGEREIVLRGQPELMAAEVAVPGDPSSAAYPLVAALLVAGSSVCVERVGLNPRRTGLLDALRAMGAAITLREARVEGGEALGDLVVTQGALRAIDLPAEGAASMIDEYPILAVACACAQGVSRLRGLGELRVKESDRLVATASLLALNGVRAEIEGDDLIVHGAGTPPGGGVVPTLLDHRLAMSALVLGCASAQPVTVDDGACIETSFPRFAALMGGLGASIGPA